MENDSFDNLMMSDSIKGQVLDLDSEATAKKFEDSFLIAALEINFCDNVTPLVGSIAGVSFEKNDCVNLDIRVNLAEAFKLVKQHNTSVISCTSFYIYLGQEELHLPSHYAFVSLKILDFDRQNNMCTLGIDMIKV